MAKQTSFDDRVRNQLKDFIGSKRWSVSRFAERYVALYGEMYSKMEAPGTSTARKLIEQKTHIFTEKEATVLERMTSLPLVQLWLENQHKVLLAKSSVYADTADNLDAESLLEWEIRRSSEKLVASSSETLVAVVQRYVAAETPKPLIVFTDDKWKFVLTILQEALPDAEKISVDFLLRHGKDVAIDTIYCFAEDIDADCIDGGRLFHKSIEIMQTARMLNHPRHVILVFETIGDEIDLIMNQWRNAAHIFRFLPSDKLVESLKPTSAETKDFREYCLSRMRSLPQIFKDEIMAQKNIPTWDCAVDCAMFIMNLYNEQRDWFTPESYFQKPLQKLIDSFFPDDWLNDDYDRESLLRAMAEYPIWLRRKEQELIAAGINVKDDDLHNVAMEGMEAVWYYIMKLDTPSLDIEGWHHFFEEAYTRILME